MLCIVIYVQKISVTCEGFTFSSVLGQNTSDIMEGLALKIQYFSVDISTFHLLTIIFSQNPLKISQVMKEYFKCMFRSVGLLLSSLHVLYHVAATFDSESGLLI